MGSATAHAGGDELTDWAVFEPNEPIDRDAEDLPFHAPTYGLTLISDAH